MACVGIAVSNALLMRKRAAVIKRCERAAVRSSLRRRARGGAPVQPKTSKSLASSPESGALLISRAVERGAGPALSRVMHKTPADSRAHLAEICARV